MKEFSSRDKQLWQRYLKAESELHQAEYEFMEGCEDKIGIVRAGLELPEQRFLALGIAAVLPVEERKQLLDPLLAIASWPSRWILRAREIVLSLPHDWLLENIEKSADLFLINDDYADYRGLIEVYIELDLDLSLRLAHRAMASIDFDVREAGEDLLARFQHLSHHGENLES